MGTVGQPWYRQLSRYHWFVLVVAALGWLFDTMDQQLFALARSPALTELLGATPADRTKVDQFGGYATSIFMIGWATGGLLFGIMGDRVGRAKTMLLTILVYSFFTGLSALSWDFWSFAFFRFLTGLGVGGEFAVGVALVAEVMPDRARPHALGWLQASSAIGNITAACINIALGVAEGEGILGEWKPWRLMFLIGAIPALVAIVVRSRLKEPERWQHEVVEKGGSSRAGSIRELLGHPTWRKHAVIGLTLAVPGVVGLWGIGFFSYDFVRRVFQESYGGTATPSDLTKLVGLVSILQNLGGAAGIYVFKRVTQRIGRRPAFLYAFLGALLSTAGTFWLLDDFYDVFWMIPTMGFCQLTLFGGYAIYFPELCPTRLRSTGISFCYNVGRYIAAIGPFTMGALVALFDSGDKVMAWRYTGVIMSLFFLIGLLALPFAPETRGKPLPE
jgi:MFS family permease